MSYRTRNRDGTRTTCPSIRPIGHVDYERGRGARVKYNRLGRLRAALRCRMRCRINRLPGTGDHFHLRIAFERAEMMSLILENADSTITSGPHPVICDREAEL